MMPVWFGPKDGEGCKSRAFRPRLGLRAGSDYGQTLRGEAFGPMKMRKCPKSVLSAFTLEIEVQMTSPPKEPRWQHF
jgi:hypothetical protein